MQTGSSEALIGWKSRKTTHVPLWDRMEGSVAVNVNVDVHEGRVAVLRIRIHFIRIRIRIQHFSLNTDPDPIRNQGFKMTEN
jgi:hypothetical protein